MTKKWGVWSKKTKDPYLKRIWRRVWRHNQNYLCICYGPTGSGKSYTALALCEMLDANFSVDNIVFSAKQFIALINAGKIKKGSAILFEELGVAANARSWFSDDNIWLSYITQVFRTLNLVVFYTVPRLEFVDGQIARLTHAHIEAQKIDRVRNNNIVKIYDPVHFQEKQRRWYKHYPTFHRGGKLYKIGKYVIKKVDNSLARAYEKKRKEYLKLLNSKAQRMFEKAEEIGSERKIISEDKMIEIVSEVVRNKELYVSDKKFDKIAVMRRFKIGGANAIKVKEAATARLRELGFHITYR